MTLSTPDSSTIVSCAASSANLLGAEVNGSCVSFAISLAKSSAKPLGALRPVPTAVPPCARRRTRGSTPSIRSMQSVDLRGIAGEFLAERQRRRILQMGAADLDDASPTLRLSARRRVHAPSARASAADRPRRAAAMCIAVGKLSLDDWPLLT